MQPSERQTTLLGIGHEQPKPVGGPRSGPDKPAPPVKLKGHLAVAGTFLELLHPRVRRYYMTGKWSDDDEDTDELGRTVLLYDDCSSCGRDTVHQFVLIEKHPTRVMVRSCLEH